jgi:serine/threonine protein kinase
MDELTGKQIDSYLIEDLAGSGITGHVYKARHVQNQQTAALKIIHPQLAAQPEFRNGLLESAAALTALKHQVIARVYNLGESDGQLFVASEWVKGDSMARLPANQSPMGLRLGARLMQMVADALVYAHRQGVIHGGLHPGNILLSPRGGDLPWQPLITDFRQASLIKGEPPLALLPYLSPEQCDGKQASGRSDVYALGVILYQLATGRLPFQPQTAREVVAAGPPPLPRSLRPDISTVFEAVILKAMSHSTAERYRSMEEFLLFLRREVDKLPPDSPGVGVQIGVASAVKPDPVQPSPPPPAPPVPVRPANISSDADYLIITHPRLPEQTFPLHKWLITIGQQSDNDLVLSGEGVARKHARLERTDMGWNVIDMGSQNGTYLENSPLLADMAEAWKPGQRVRLGEYMLAWRSGAAVPPDDKLLPPDKRLIQEKGGQLYATLKPTQLVTHPGSPAQAVLEIENQAGEATFVTLAVADVPPSWVAIEPVPIHLAPQQKVIVPFTIQPPRHSSARAGLHTFQIEARPDNGLVAPAVCPGQLTINPFAQLFAEVRPSSLRHGQPGEVVLHNEGNTPGRYTAAATDVGNEVKFEFLQQEADVLPGQTQALSIVGRARKRPFFLRNRIIPFEIKVTSGPQNMAQPARLVAPPLLSWWLLLALALPLLFILLFAAITGGTAYTKVCDGYFMDGSLEDECAAITAAAQATPVATPTVAATAQPGVVTRTVVMTPTAAVSSPQPTSPPEITAESIIIGQSAGGLDIEALKLGNGPNVVLFVGGLYAGFSPASTSLAREIVLELSADLTLIPDDVTVYVIPLWNPDSEKSANGRYNGNEVDLNRNWNCHWQAAANSSFGTAPRSESETQALYNFIAEIDPVAAVFWNTPRPERLDLYGVVSPGRCTLAQSDVSQSLAQTYAGPTDSYQARQADPTQNLSGDVTDSLADMGIPAIFVLLDSQMDVDAAQHLPAVLAVLNKYSNSGD